MITAEKVLKAVRQSPRIPAPSQVVARILALTNNPNCHVHVIAELVQRDSALTGALLGQANSALYAGAKPTSSVRDACVRLGLKRVRSIAINDHVVSGLSKACPAGFDPHRYWQGALATSVAARDIAGDLMPDMAEEAGTAGLLVDVGIGLLAYGASAVYKPVLTKMRGCLGVDVEAAERSILGITHAEVGAAVLGDWKLDTHLVEAVRLHHADEHTRVDKTPDRFAGIVSAAVTCSQIALGGSDMESVERLFNQVGAITSQPDILVGKILDQLVGHLQDAARELTVELGETASIESNIDELTRNLPEAYESMSFKPMERQASAQ